MFYVFFGRSCYMCLISRVGEGMWEDDVQWSFVEVLHTDVHFQHFVKKTAQIKPNSPINPYPGSPAVDY